MLWFAAWEVGWFGTVIQTQGKNRSIQFFNQQPLNPSTSQPKKYV